MSEPRSRRALLGAGLGAALATLFGRTPQARADNTDPLVLGSIDNAASSETSLTVDTGLGFGLFTVHGDGFFSSADEGRAINGLGSTGGVLGQTRTGVGVEAFSVSGTALKATIRSSDASAVAFEALGRLRLSTAGVAVIPAGRTSVVVTPGPVNVVVVPNAVVALSPRADLGARRLWYTIPRGPDPVSFVIHMSPSRTTRTRIGWLLVEPRG